MFKLNQNYKNDSKILKCEHIRYIPAETSIINTPNSQICFNIARGDSNISLLNSYLELNFEFVKKADNSRYANGNDIRLVNLAPIALFSNFDMTTSSGKLLEYVSYPHIVSLLYKLMSSAEDFDDLSIGLGRDRGRRQQELTNNKNIKAKFHLRIMLKGIFAFAECQQKAIYSLG